MSFDAVLSINHVYLLLGLCWRKLCTGRQEFNRGLHAVERAGHVTSNVFSLKAGLYRRVRNHIMGRHLYREPAPFLTYTYL